LSSTRHYAPNTNQLLTNYSFITRSLALSLALKTSFNRLIHCEFMPRWPVRAVDYVHFAPPIQRTRRDGLVHCRSVPLPVALGGNDYPTSQKHKCFLLEFEHLSANSFFS
jgi:hypothetical protein